MATGDVEVARYGDHRPGDALKVALGVARTDARRATFINSKNFMISIRAIETIHRV